MLKMVHTLLTGNFTRYFTVHPTSGCGICANIFIESIPLVKKRF